MRKGIKPANTCIKIYSLGIKCSIAYAAFGKVKFGFMFFLAIVVLSAFFVANEPVSCCTFFSGL